MAREPSAAEALYPHLRAQVPERPPQQSSRSLADTLHPSLAQTPAWIALDRAGVWQRVLEFEAKHRARHPRQR
jgi:hypothetical protein